MTPTPFEAWRHLGAPRNLLAYRHRAVPHWALLLRLPVPLRRLGARLALFAEVMMPIAVLRILVESRFFTFSILSSVLLIVGKPAFFDLMFCPTSCGLFPGAFSSTSPCSSASCRFSSSFVLRGPLSVSLGLQHRGKNLAHPHRRFHFEKSHYAVRNFRPPCRAQFACRGIDIARYLFRRFSFVFLFLFNVSGIRVALFAEVLMLFDITGSPSGADCDQSVFPPQW